jgi:hypothetical protein
MLQVSDYTSMMRSESRHFSENIPDIIGEQPCICCQTQATQYNFVYLDSSMVGSDTVAVTASRTSA